MFPPHYYYRKSRDGLEEFSNKDSKPSRLLVMEIADVRKPPHHVR
jgi:hypothetical protein